MEQTNKERKKSKTLFFVHHRIPFYHCFNQKNYEKALIIFSVSFVVVVG